MCGITGFLHRIENPRAVISNMTDALRHRGPDEGGVWCDPGIGVALGHRRLSILDLSPAGAQPMVSASGRHIISFNGEIYNFAELRAELDHAGYPFRGHSDTEVLLAAVEEWGIDRTLSRIDGMFAFALWNRQDRSLLLARDRAGKKPLYYGWSGSSFLFGSELKALTAFPGFDKGIDRNALGEFICLGWIPEPLSIYTSVRKLSPGSFIKIPLDAPPWSANPELYWNANTVCEYAANHTFAGSFDDAVERLDGLLHQAVRTRMVADVEVGALLSGGIDSTTVVALMQRHSGRPVKTFTIGFSEPRFDEARHAAAIASHLGTDHHELYVSPNDCLDLVDTLPRVYDEPFADISQLPTLLVCRLAREQVKVTLSGDGGDELFCGYTHYFEAQKQWRAMTMLPLTLQKLIRRWAIRYDHASWWLYENIAPGNASPSGWRRAGSKLEKITRGWGNDLPQQFLLERSARLSDPRSLVIGAGKGGTNFRLEANWLNKTDPLLQMRHLDYIGFLPGDILVKVDRASMSVGLEMRAPILDTRVTEFAWSLPAGFLVDRKGGKRVLRGVMNRYVPPQLTDRPKRGFSPPLEDWLRGPFHSRIGEMLDASLLADQGFFKPEKAHQIWKQHQSGWRNHSNLLWALLIFQSWLMSTQ
jgi:asparagine synthase (glutamine-hydrolysing)